MAFFLKRWDYLCEARAVGPQTMDKHDAGFTLSRHESSPFSLSTIAKCICIRTQIDFNWSFAARLKHRSFKFLGSGDRDCVSRTLWAMVQAERMDRCNADAIVSSGTDRQSLMAP
jgi:hypothetical protein